MATASSPIMFEGADPGDRFLLMELHRMVEAIPDRSSRKLVRDCLLGFIHANSMESAEEVFRSRKPEIHEPVYTARYMSGLLTTTVAWRKHGKAGVKKHLREVRLPHVVSLPHSNLCPFTADI